MADIAFFIASAAAIFVVVNPIGNVPFFQTLTAGYDSAMKKRVIMKVIYITLGALILFGLFGKFIFAIYGITLPAFEIAGGILLFTTSFSMLQGENPRTKASKEDEDEALARESVGIVPLGIPLFAGPGAITTVIIFFGEAKGVLDAIFVLVSIAITVVASYVALVYSEPLFRRMGRMGAMAFSRIEGILLAALAVQFIITGVTAVLHAVL
ncbi:MAG: MarC family protein [Candidatus Thermoplasmatota archaeon]|nr:NAAT family transporter [Candidatus Sysuiplasma jiujiangense]MBX8639414.1 MarC family protein [Candidatus Sysuiplasma jiujiangense]MBX8641557.1 MarC family protein [Candidatus Sysuiplasma jiujiangense]MCL4317622.1 MarC family protein [Candidatus Thermoplasmatota archaeon]